MSSPVQDERIADRGPQLTAILWVLTGASTITVIFRFIARAQKAGVGWDDFFMLVALLCLFGWTICLTILCANGGERHIQDVVALGPDVVARVQLLNWTSQVFGIFGVGAGKVSVSALLLGILRNTWRDWQVIYLWVVCITLEVCVSTACSILTFAQCRPAAALWDARIPGKCINPKIMADFGTFTGAWNTFVDASLAIIPSTIFWRLQMSTQEKAQLSIVFAINILTSICSGIKTSYLSQLANRKDFTWATYDIFVWVTAEFFLVIFCGTLPTLKPILNFIRRYVLRMPTSNRKVSSRSYQRHTGDESTPQEETALRLSPMRPDGTSSHTVVSAFEDDYHHHYHHRTGLKDDRNNHITVERTYEVHSQVQ